MICTSVKRITWDTLRSGLRLALLIQWRNTKSLHTAKHKTHTYTRSGLVCMHTHMHRCKHMHIYMKGFVVGSAALQWRSDRRRSQHQTTLQVWFLLRSLFAHTHNTHTNILQRLLISSGLREKQLPHQAALLWVNHTCQRAKANLWINL